MREVVAVLDGPLGGQGLGGEAHVHDRGGVALGGGEVDEAAFAEKEETLAAGQGVAVDVVADILLALGGHGGEGLDVDLDVEVAGVADDGAVLHGLEVVLADDVHVAGQGDEEVADLGGLLHGHDVEAVHGGLQGAHRVHLGDHHLGAHAAGARGHAPAAPAVAATTTRLPASSTSVARMMPSMVDWPVP